MRSSLNPNSSATVSMGSMDKLKIEGMMYRNDLEQPLLFSESATESEPFLPDKAWGEPGWYEGVSRGSQGC